MARLEQPKSKPLKEQIRDLFLELYQLGWKEAEELTETDKKKRLSKVFTKKINGVKQLRLGFAVSSYSWKVSFKADLEEGNWMQTHYVDLGVSGFGRHCVAGFAIFLNNAANHIDDKYLSMYGI